jgi:hypothetical protein
VSKDLYEKCGICLATGTLDPARTDLRIELAPGQQLDRRDDGSIICPACAGERYRPIGLTVRAVERMREELERLRGGAPFLG